jgi:hypothetical protein
MTMAGSKRKQAGKLASAGVPASASEAKTEMKKRVRARRSGRDA